MPAEHMHDILEEIGRSTSETLHCKDAALIFSKRLVSRLRGILFSSDAAADRTAEV